MRDPFRIDACRLCGVRRGLERHHLVPRSQGGRDGPLVTLCGAFENGCHPRVTENHRLTLVELRALLFDDEIAAVVAMKGEAWLERRYPASLDVRPGVD